MKKLLSVSLLAMLLLAPLAGAQAPADCNDGVAPAYNNCPAEPMSSCATTDQIVAYFLAPPAGTGEFTWLSDLLGDDAAILLGIQCAVSDINGDDGSGDLPMPNGMLDAFELALIEELMYNSSAHAALGAWVAQVQPQFRYNYQQLWTSGMSSLVMLQLPILWPTLQGMLIGQDPPIVVPDYDATMEGIIRTIFPGLMALLAEFGTIGDADTLGAVVEVGGLLALCGVVGSGCLVNDLHADLVAGFPAKLAPDGDADGDGLTNRQEYDNVLAQGKPEPAKVDCYVMNALNPTMDGTSCAPPDCAPDMYPSVVNVAVGGNVRIVGDASCLQATTPITWSWDHSTKGDLGETSNTLVITNIDASYEGSIVATADDGTKAFGVSDPINITVHASAPLAGGLGLGLLAGVCALGGALSIRRKR